MATVLTLSAPAGVRRGELMALRWEDVDLKAGRLSVERSCDPAAQEYRRPKSRQGVRKVPVSGTLAPYLREHMIRTGRREGFVFGSTATRPFTSTPVQERADAAWSAVGLERAGSASAHGAGSG